MAAGVTITTSVRTGPTNAQLAATATMFVAGVTERGPDGTCHLVTNISDFQDIFGAKVSDGWVYQTVETFFEEGGARAYVSRVVDESAVEAEAELLDSSASVCVTLIASGTGTWANTQLEAEVTNPSVTTFKVKIKLDGATVWTSSTHSTPEDFIEEVNNDPTAALYVTAVAGTSTNIADADTYSFSGGTDGGALVDADLVTALDTFTNNLGPGAVCAPGFTSNAARLALLSNAQDNNRIAVMSFDKDATVAEAISEAADFSVEDNASYGSFFYPWVKIPNGSLTQVVPPEGYVCGKRAKVHNQFGSWTPWAGEKTQADFVTGVYSSMTKAEAGDLDDGNVNPIRVINGTVRVYGARSLSNDTANYRFIISREVLNQITYEAEQALEALLFLPIDGRKSTFSRVQATLTAILDRIRIGGGLYEAFDAFGKQIDPGYTVQVNDANNPISQLATGAIKAKIGARVSSIGDKIEVEITKSNLTATLV
jgi:hypothetical protein